MSALLGPVSLWTLQYIILRLLQRFSSSDYDTDSPENDPDGVYAFKRKPGCSYHAVSTHKLFAYRIFLGRT